MDSSETIVVSTRMIKLNSSHYNGGYRRVAMVSVSTPSERACIHP